MIGAGGAHNVPYGFLGMLSKPAPAPSRASGVQSPPIDLGGTANLSPEQQSAIDAAKFRQGQQQAFNSAQAAGSSSAAGYLPSGTNPFGGLPPGMSAPANRSTVIGQPYSPSSNLIDSMPGVADALLLEHNGIGQLDDSLKAARERAIVNFGDPAMAQMAGFGLDPQAGVFARQNYLSGNSTLSRLDKAHQLAQQAVINRLAGHGILNSGDLGYLEGQENQNYGNNVYDAQQSVLGQLADLYSGYLSNRGTLEQSVNTARMNALQSYMSNPDLYATLFGVGQGSTGTNDGTTANNKTAAKPAAQKPAATVMRGAVAANKASKTVSKFLAGAF